MELPQVVVWELSEYLERGELITLGTASKELRYIKYSKHYYSLSVHDGLFDTLCNVRCLTLSEFDLRGRNPLAPPEIPNISRLSLYNSELEFGSIFENLTSLFIFQDCGVKVAMLAVDCPLQKLSFNIIEADLNFMEHVQILYPGLKLINIFTRYDQGDFPILRYDFKKNQTLGIGWKKHDSLFSLDFHPDDVSETCLACNETIVGLYTRIIDLLSKDRVEFSKASIPIIKRLSLFNNFLSLH
ncbi:hypothetical protein DSO57_1009619 [Entomophthora muscae]|uniref:Uncharacterized protein n=1 Tax=Entomophthora muscae TaxID=34485 RepID=A0ACC2T6V5_9FUNG|nr:hypothetical protein DSO57_1009619 [Entomophthora muscae]